jgi:large subunit ribosomal protein L17
MRHRQKGRRLGVSTPHRRSMLANLASSLIEHGGINTTEARAKELARFVQPLVTLAKRGDLHARRRAYTYLRNWDAVKKLFDEWAPNFETLVDAEGVERPWNGGYTRVLKLGRRKGDSAAISMIEFVTPATVEQTTGAAVDGAVATDDDAVADETPVPTEVDEKAVDVEAVPADEPAAVDADDETKADSDGNPNAKSEAGS